MELKDVLQINMCSIVFIGNFNPAVFQPFWLANKKLIRESEAEQTKLELIHNDLVKFDLGWVNLQVTQERFELRTTQEPYFLPVRDLAIGVFTLLNETPITSLGINHVFHCAFKDEKTLYEFGNLLSPLNNWNTQMNEPRLLNLAIIEQKRMDGLDGHYRIQILPSKTKLTTKFAVEININDHFNIMHNQTGRNGEMISVLKDNWDSSFQKAQSISNHILSLI